MPHAVLPLSLLRTATWLDRARALAYARVLALFMAAALAFDWVSTAIGHHPWGRIMGPPGKPQATDFLAFWAAGRQALRLGGGAAYDVSALSAFEHGTAIFDPGAILPFYYPPSFLLLCLPFAALPYVPAFAAFLACQAVTLALGLRRILPRLWLPPGRQGLWGYLPVLAFPGMLMNAATGQNGFWTASCFAWGLLWLEVRPLAAGACLGMLVIKPHLALVVPLALAASRRWRALLACGATAAGWLVLSWMVLGDAAWRGFLASLPAIRAALEEHPEELAKLQSLFAAARLCGAPLRVAYVAQTLLTFCVLGAMLAVARRKGSQDGGTVAAMAAASMLCTPYVLDYDLAVTGVPLAWLASRAADQGWLPYEKLGAGVAFLWPLVARMAGTDWHMPIGPLVLAGLFALVCRRAWHGADREESAPC